VNVSEWLKRSLPLLSSTQLIGDLVVAGCCFMGSGLPVDEPERCLFNAKRQLGLALRPGLLVVAALRAHDCMRYGRNHEAVASPEGSRRFGDERVPPTR